MKNYKKNLETDLYEFVCPEFVFEFDENDKEYLDRYWIERSGKDFDTILDEAEDGIKTVVDVLLGVALNKLESDYKREPEK